MLRGSQLATTRLIPDGMSNNTAVTLARASGMMLDPWQDEILTESGRRDHDGQWSAFQVGAIVPRQNGKSYLIVARALAGALLYNDKLTLYSAHEYRTAREVWRTMVDLCESDYLSPLVRQIYTRGGFEEIIFHNGNRFKLIARTKTAGRGMSPDCILFDEAFALTDDVLSASLPSMSARPNPQVWYLSSAATWEALVLLRLRQQGHSGVAQRFAYWEWHADHEDDIADPLVWAKANPALNIGNRLSDNSVRNELVSMTRKAFQRERLGIWQESALDSVLNDDDVEKLAVDVPRPPMDGRLIAWGVDVEEPGRTSAAIAAAFRGDDGVPVVTLVDVRPGAGWLPERLAALDASYHLEAVAYDARAGIADLMERAERDYNVPLQGLRQSEYPSACAAFVQRVTEGTVHIARAPRLIGDCNAAVARNFIGGWVWNRKTASPPTALIAATCALYSLEHNEGGSSIAVY